MLWVDSQILGKSNTYDPERKKKLVNTVPDHPPHNVRSLLTSKYTVMIFEIYDPSVSLESALG